MTVREMRREAALEAMADHLLAEGLAAASLRALAAAAGTSDRMLLYYFADKEEMIAAILERVAGRLAVELDAALPASPRRSLSALLPAIWSVVRSPNLKSHMSLWLELAAGAARGFEPQRAVAGAIAEGFLAWIALRLDAADAELRLQSQSALAAIEGAVVLQAVGKDEAAAASIAAAARLHLQGARA